MTALRCSVGSKYGAQHSQDWSALAHHIPGLKVVYPVTPYDAKGMMNTALAGTVSVTGTGHGVPSASWDRALTAARSAPLR